MAQRPVQCLSAGSPSLQSGVAAVVVAVAARGTESQWHTWWPPYGHRHSLCTTTIGLAHKEWFLTLLPSGWFSTLEVPVWHGWLWPSQQIADGLLAGSRAVFQRKSVRVPPLLEAQHWAICITEYLCVRVRLILNSSRGSARTEKCSACWDVAHS